MVRIIQNGQDNRIIRILQDGQDDRIFRIDRIHKIVGWLG